MFVCLGMVVIREGLCSSGVVKGGVSVCAR